MDVREELEMQNANGLPEYERIYDTDLVYVPDCWRLCGDAHCCSFGRYKSQFNMIARTPFQELPLLPGEYAFLESKGWLTQFGDHEHKVVSFPIEGYTLRAESIVSRRPNCACDHDTRPTICRLYPLLPVFDVGGRLIETGQLGIFEELEDIAGMDAACQLKSIPFEQLNKFITLVDELGKSPICNFYLKAYQITKRHIAERIRVRYEQNHVSVFSSFEAAFIRRKLVDVTWLSERLGDVAREFERFYGSQFKDSMDANELPFELPVAGDVKSNDA